MKFDADARSAPTAELPAGLPATLETATREVFEIMLATPLKAVNHAEPPLVADLTVMVGLTGQMRGVLSMHCSVDSACLWASKMIGTEMRDFDHSVRDAIGEICNMIAGNFKRKLPGIGNGCLISTPTVISGADYHLHSLSGGEHVEISMGFDGAPLWVTLDLRN